MEDTGTTIAACTRDSGADGDTPGTLYWRGRAHVQRLFCGGDSGEFDRAMADLDDAIRENPDFREAYALRVLAHEYRGDHAGAVRDFRRAYRLGVPPQWLVERLETFEGAP